MIHARKEYNSLNDEEGIFKEDEPVFILRASDLLAPVTLLYWANRLELTGGDAELVKQIKQYAYDMLNWQMKNEAKLLRA